MPRIKRKEQPVRLNIVMLPSVKKVLERLKTDTQAESLSEVIRKAIALYELVTVKQASGWRFVFITEDEERRQELHIL